MGDIVRLLQKATVVFCISTAMVTVQSLWSQAQVLEPTLQTQNTDEFPTLLAKGKTEDKGTTEGMGKEGDQKGKDKHCETPPGTCYSTNVQAGDGSGCASGSKCTAENTVCDRLHNYKCKTMGAPGTCYCSCQ